MIKIFYFILLAAELFVDVLLMMSLWDSCLYIPIAIAAVALAVLLTWQIVLLAKATDIAVKKKRMLGIVLSMLIPIAVFCVTYVFVAATFIVAFA